MNITMENKKQKAIELLNTLDIYKPYIRGFEKDNLVCYFEGFGGFWAYQEPELMNKIKEFEEEHNALVYAVTHEYKNFEIDSNLASKICKLLDMKVIAV